MLPGHLGVAFERQALDMWWCVPGGAGGQTGPTRIGSTADCIQWLQWEAVLLGAEGGQEVTWLQAAGASPLVPCLLPCPSPVP